MARRLTPDPLQVDPFTEPVRIKLSSFTHIRVSHQGIFGAGWSGGVGKNLGIGLVTEQQNVFKSWHHPDLEAGIGFVTPLFERGDGKLEAKNTSATLPDTASVEGIPHPMTTATLKIVSLIHCDDENGCYPEPREDEFIVDLGAHRDDGDIVEVRQDGSEDDYFQKLTPLTRWWILNGGTLGIVSQGSFEQDVIEPKSGGTISIGGQTYPLIPVGVRVRFNLKGRRTDWDREDIRQQFEPIKEPGNFSGVSVDSDIINPDPPTAFDIFDDEEFEAIAGSGEIIDVNSIYRIDRENPIT